MNQILIFILLTLTFVVCNSHDKKEVASDEIPVMAAALDNENLMLLKTYCYACHNPASKSHDEVIAPPLVAVKMRYKMQFETKEEFINRMSQFVREPKLENAIMFGAVQRFKLMPKSLTDEKIINQIVTYIEENEMEEPVWFREEFRRNGRSGLR